MLLPAAAAVCALAAARCCPLEVLAGTSRPPVSLGSSSGWRCCARRRVAHGDAAQGYQCYKDDAAPCDRHGRAAAAEARPRRSVRAGAHTLTPFGGLGRLLDLSLTSTKPVTEQHLLNHAEPLIYIDHSTYEKRPHAASSNITEVSNGSER
ncbi:hypothetical protein T492DRAFT_1019325 [Pavlovales sp. CCMP2436]|nr:hypothetical protein T492DRAFT_1019325 [Pavlovales sp. CCMP2436]